MSPLAIIEAAVDALPPADKQELLLFPVREVERADRREDEADLQRYDDSEAK